MDKFVTVATFDLPSQAYVIKNRLESEGILCFLKDEHTIQANGFYSYALGGVKLQVLRKDSTAAIEILLETGYLKKEDFLPGTFWTKVDEHTNKIPFISTFSPPIRLFIFGALGAIIFSLAFLFILTPNTYEKLTTKSWCLSHVTYNGQIYHPNSLAYKLSFYGKCEETLLFKGNQKFTLPGFNTRPIQGVWQLKDNSLYITKTDTLGYVFEGKYRIKHTEGSMELISEKTTIYCYLQ